MEFREPGNKLTKSKSAAQVAGGSCLSAGDGNRMEGIMRIRRAILPAILALGVAGSVVAGSAISIAAGPAPASHTQVVAGTHFHN